MSKSLILLMMTCFSSSVMLSAPFPRRVCKLVTRLFVRRPTPLQPALKLWWQLRWSVGDILLARLGSPFKAYLADPSAFVSASDGGGAKNTTTAEEPKEEEEEEEIDMGGGMDMFGGDGGGDDY